MLEASQTPVPTQHSDTKDRRGRTSLKDPRLSQSWTGSGVDFSGLDSESSGGASLSGDVMQSTTEKRPFKKENPGLALSLGRVVVVWSNAALRGTFKLLAMLEVMVR